jgi:hypothetical protein
MKIFIYTEVFNCGLIGKKCLETFFKYHPDTKVHVAGTFKDFKELGKLKNVEYIDFSGDEKLKQFYKTGGHFGTAYIFTKVLKREFGVYDYVIHFDSDVIFKKECISDIIKKFEEGYDLVGPRRPYKNNVANTKNQYDDKKDVVSTYFFGYNINKITEYNFEILQNMIVGYYNPLGFNVIDFFDPISFDILKNNGKIFYLDFEKYGSCNENGSWENSFGELNKLLDFGSYLAHFAGIGSGMNFYNNGRGQVPETYSSWALKRFAIYMKVFYNKDVDVEYDINEFEKIKKSLENE